MSGTHNVEHYLDHLEFCGLVNSELRHLHHQETFVCFQTFPYQRHRRETESVYTARDGVKDGNQPKRKKNSSGIEQDIEVLQRQEIRNEVLIAQRILWTQS